MAFFGPGQTPSDEPFLRFAGPMDVSSSALTAIQALWQNLPKADRSFANLLRAANDEFDRTTAWWLKLEDRAGYRIVQRVQKDFGPPQSMTVEDIHRADADPDNAAYVEMFKWMPGQSMAEAFFNAWLLQAEGRRDVARTISLVRGVLDRQLAAAEQDIAAFATPEWGN